MSKTTKICDVLIKTNTNAKVRLQVYFHEAVLKS